MALNLVGTSGNATIDASTGIDGFSITFDTWTTSTRPGSPTTGQTGFNTELGYLESWNGSSWVGGLPSQAGNSGKYLTTDGSTASWVSLPPSITNVTPSSFDGNAGQSFAVAGLNFYVGCSTVFIGNDGVTTYATTTTRNNSSSLTVVNSVDMPIANEPYTLKVINTDGQYALYAGLDAGSAPSWTTASGSLGSWEEGAAVSTSVIATDPDGGAVTYSSSDVGSGSLNWLSLNTSTGALTGTAPLVASDTSYSFSVTATDNASNSSSRSFSVTVTNIVPVSSVEYLVVAGGGGGGGGPDAGAGGGAGGYRTASGFAVSSGSAITVTVGAGGAGGAANNAGTSGSNSVFSSITSTGGGGGGQYIPSVTNSSGTGRGYGKDGGSGGGAASGPGSGRLGGSPASGQGYAGGNANEAGPYLSGGGGGAGGAGDGGTGYGSGTGNGGPGLSSSITGSAVTRAGGGGGSKYLSLPAGQGGSGGGGNGTDGSIPAGNGTTNTGSGGGGSERNGSYLDGGSGGSGIVVIRYPDSYAAAASTTGSPTYTVSGGYRIYTWTSSGSITF